MKYLFILFFFTFSTLSFAQNNHIVKTEDGRRVLLKADFTWEYIDLENPKPEKPVATLPKPEEKNNCNIPLGFTEPKLNSKLQAQLKRGRASITHIKKKVAKDFNCPVNKVLLLSATEKKENGVYEFCADGTNVSYKRVGNTIIKKGKLF